MPNRGRGVTRDVLLGTLILVLVAAGVLVLRDHAAASSPAATPTAAESPPTVLTSAVVPSQPGADSASDQSVDRMSAAAAGRSVNGSRVIGRSVQGRPIVATAFGDPAASRVVVVIGAMHGSETAGFGVTDLLARGGVSAGVRIWIVRDVNPDGTARRQRQNARGVDLNRNTPHLWRRSPRGTYYSGPRAASEPETRTYMNFLTQLRPDLVLIFHQHLNGVDSYGAKDDGLLAMLARAFRLSIKSFDCSGVCRGTLTGWFNSLFPGSAVTIELPVSVSGTQATRIARGIRQVSARVRDVQ